MWLFVHAIAASAGGPPELEGSAILSATHSVTAQGASARVASASVSVVVLTSGLGEVWFGGVLLETGDRLLLETGDVVLLE